MTIKFNAKLHSFVDLPCGTVFTLSEPDPKYIYLSIDEINTEDGDSYNAINLTNMEYQWFDDMDSVIPYKATLTIE